jgi:hypothetical protein
VADMGESKISSEDGVPGEAQLVSLLLVYIITQACADDSQAKGLRCDLAIWSSAD